ncbi:hypothetical protein BBJ28_00018682 [Nothophytophthora sp. Chile5]|nr:hypothetical protein BBJ28_00018682 [Nothophytophthora sp. Chile5]
MESFYGYHLGLFTLCETRWNSMQFCFASLIRVRSALQMLARKYKHTSEFPSALLALDQSSFWDDLAKAERVIEPLAIASFRLQRDENTVADVVISYRDIFRGFQAINGSSSTLVACVEARWAQCEQPLFMLRYALHPSHIGDSRQLASTGTVVSSRSQLCKFAVYYYRRFIGEDFGSIRSEMRQWLTGEMTSALAVEFPNSVEFWHYVEDEHPRSKLPDLALKVLSIAVNTATCERLFSELSLIHTAKRNRMTSTKAHDTHVICKHIRQRDQKATSELLIRTLPSQEREIGEAGLRMQRSLVMPEGDADSQQRLLRFTSPSPRAGRPRLPPTAPSDDEALDDIGDGVNEEDTFLLWDEYLEEVFDDDEVADVYAEASLYHDGPEDETELAPIPRPDRTPFPARNEPNFPQERALGGIRAHKVSLADLFA